MNDHREKKQKNAKKDNTFSACLCYHGEKGGYAFPKGWIHMKRDMRQWVRDTIAAPVKSPMPLLSFPCIQLLDVTVRELISDSALQAKGMKAVADRIPSAASVSLMDLSVEAECFGATVRFSDDEVPTIVGALLTEPEDADALAIPAVGTARTGIYIDAISKAMDLITDRPVFAGVIGPFSLAGRLMDVSEAMILCYDEPEMVHTVLSKSVSFLIDYCRAYQKAGANGVVIAEPLAGLMSPALAAEFSHTYVKQIIDAVQTDTFAVIYHNCGNNVPLMVDDIYQLGAVGYHFGDAVEMTQMLPAAPDDVLVMGNVSPAAQFLNGTPESISAVTRQIMDNCCEKPNFVISSGCDIPPLARWENVDAFFAAARDFYA